MHWDLTPGPKSPGFIRDIATYLDWSKADDANRPLAVLGSDRLEIEIIQRTSDTSALVQFQASSTTSAASMLRINDVSYRATQAISPNSAPFSSVSQTFTWKVEITW